MNTLVTRTVKPNFLPLIPNHGLKNKRRMLYCPMDFDELTLDGFLDTGALSGAIQEADLRRV